VSVPPFFLPLEDLPPLSFGRASPFLSRMVFLFSLFCAEGPGRGPCPQLALLSPFVRRGSPLTLRTGDWRFRIASFFSSGIRKENPPFSPHVAADQVVAGPLGGVFTPFFLPPQARLYGFPLTVGDEEGFFLSPLSSACAPTGHKSSSVRTMRRRVGPYLSFCGGWTLHHPFIWARVKI